MDKAHITIVGAGVVGLSIARALSYAHKGIVVLEKHETFGQETSSRNSEVIHAGLYYEPESLKAQTCIRGNALLYEFCQTYKIGHQRLGKLVVATTDAELKKISHTYDNALASGVKDLSWLTKEEITQKEPAITARYAFFSPNTGIIDTRRLMQTLHQHAQNGGALFSFATKLIGIQKKRDGYTLTVQEANGKMFRFDTTYLINAAGLGSEEISHLVGIDTIQAGYHLHPCKGQYFRLKRPQALPLQHLIYPPSTAISLGIHLTPDLGGGIRLGPDATYVDEFDYAVNPADAHIFWEAVRPFLPKLLLEDLIPDTAGIRPKIQAQGKGFRDFCIQEERNRGLPGCINLVGIESPGLTAAFAIAELVNRHIVS